MLMLVLSLVLGLIPLVGIVLIALAGWIATVDGLFTSLILAAISGVFFLNTLLEARALGLLPFLKRPGATTTTSAASSRPSAQRSAAGPPTPPPPPSADGVVTETGVVEGVRLYEMPVGYADRSLVSFRAEGSPSSRSMVFSGNVQHLRAGRKIRISYKPLPDGNQLLAWE
ncbi:MAG TPA: hypothetical protein VMS96_10025 [Terriglobales bacterium]|nr:hypothetical protein [Terriglobales bacterium]